MLGRIAVPTPLRTSCKSAAKGSGPSGQLDHPDILPAAPTVKDTLAELIGYQKYYYLVETYRAYV